MHQKLIILDFGSQYTQLIARRVRELNIYCEIHPWNKIPQLDSDVLGVILSGSPFSTLDELAPNPNLSEIKGKIPLLGVCYGAQFLVQNYGGKVLPSNTIATLPLPDDSKSIHSTILLPEYEKVKS